MKTQTTQDSEHSILFDLTKFESDSHFIKFITTDIFIGETFHKQFYLPNIEHSAINKLLRKHKIDTELDKYFYWSFICFDWLKEHHIDSKEYSEKQVTFFRGLKDYYELLSQLNKDQITLVEVIYTFKSSSKKKQSILFQDGTILDLIKKETNKTQAEVELQKVEKILKNYVNGSTALTSKKEILIMIHVLNLREILKNQRSPASKKQFNSESINYLVGNLMQHAGIIKITENDSKKSISGNVRTRINSFNKMIKEGK
ncbi:MAG: hypothetical protein IPJ86_14345 [Bacteroidetes bacterium]|nr:hypothetical protein [Bacteroidota bacterium]